MNEEQYRGPYTRGVFSRCPGGASRSMLISSGGMEAVVFLRAGYKAWYTTDDCTSAACGGNPWDTVPGQTFGTYPAYWNAEMAS
jgi:hypothetical protein